MKTAAVPIQTEYRGYRFRSRLEARWAVFLDAIGRPWEYERQGYSLPSGNYLPDFWLPIEHEAHPDAGYWLEIKGDEPTREELRLCCELTDATRHHCILLAGSPDPERVRVWKSMIFAPRFPDADGEGVDGDPMDFPAMVDGLAGCETDGWGKPRVTTVEDLFWSTMGYAWYHSPARSLTISGLDAALRKARSARFEHGETPFTRRA